MKYTIEELIQAMKELAKEEEKEDEKIFKSEKGKGLTCAYIRGWQHCQKTITNILDDFVNRDVIFDSEVLRKLEEIRNKEEQ